MQILHKIHKVSKILQSESHNNQIKNENLQNGNLNKKLEIKMNETKYVLMPLIKKYLEKCNNTALKDTLQDCIEAKEAYDRALFVRLGCEAVGGYWKKTLDAMLAVELTDFSVLTIDDILDEAILRMGLPSIHKRYSEKTAIIAASILKSLSTEAIIKCTKQNHLDSQKLGEVVLLLEKSHRQIYVGQFLDIYYEDLEFDQVTTDMYLEMIKYTTGSQISACIKIGAILGAGKKKEVKALGDYGLYTGIIFQIRDDLIDYIDDENLINKMPFLDLNQKKKRWPILFAYKNNPEEVKRLFSLKQISKYEIINQYNIIAQMKEILNGLSNSALEGLEFVKNSKIRELLKYLVNLGIDI